MLLQITAALLQITTMCYYKLRQHYQIITNYGSFMALKLYSFTETYVLLFSAETYFCFILAIDQLE